MSLLKKEINKLKEDVSLLKKKLPVGIETGPYTYNYTYVPPLAYANGIHPEDLPSLDWVIMVGKQALKIFLNGLIVDAEEAEKTIAFDLKELLDALVKGTEHEFIKHLDNEAAELLGFLGDRNTLEKDNRFQSAEGIVDWFEKLINRVRQVTSHTQTRTLEQYNDLFKIIEIPEISKHLFNDEDFANLRVAGFNPLVITRLESIPANFPITQAQFCAAPGFEKDSLTLALQEGRLYLADYEALNVLKPGQVPASKHVYRPIALFGVPVSGKYLQPIAIQVDQTPKPGNMFGPLDGPNWEKAKSCVNAADGNYHEMISHLGRTHLLVGPFAVATHRKLPTHHPLYALLMPHFQGTIFINGAAVDFLVNPGGPVDELLMGTIESDLTLSANGVLATPFDASWLPVWLKNRGLDDTSKLPYYPYRDDGLLVWEAIRNWVATYLSVYYSSDADVLADSDLQAWAADLISNSGGRVAGFGQKGGIRTREYLVDALTMIIFTASAAHAAVNFPQLGIMSYTPAVPLAGYEPTPNTFDRKPYPWIDILPPINMAKEQIQVLYLLGGVYYTQLGQYGEDHFKDPQIIPLLRRFQTQLDQIEATIRKRNLATTHPYTYLLPSKIPQSINI